MESKLLSPAFSAALVGLLVWLGQTMFVAFMLWWSWFEVAGAFFPTMSPIFAVPSYVSVFFLVIFIRSLRALFKGWNK